MKTVILRDGSICDGCRFEVIREEDKRTLVRDSNGDKFWLKNKVLEAVNETLNRQ